MRWSLLVAASLLAVGFAAPPPAAAQGTGMAPSIEAPRAARKQREPTAGQMAARERIKKCGAEWKAAKTRGETAGMRWSQYWSKCNSRLKGNQV